MPALYKLYEKVINSRIQKWLILENIKFPNQQQQGFQKNKGCINASFNIHETIYYNLEQGSNVYVAFADIQKAFDTVLHKGLIYLVKKLGIKGKILQSIISCYTNIQSFVKINGLDSEPFFIRRGVRQGGVLSSFLYLIYINDLLTCLENSKLGTYVCNTYSGNTALADDIALLAINPKNLQKMLNIVSDYAKKWKFVINKTKTVIVNISLSSKILNNISFQMENENLKTVDFAEHVGIPISKDMKCKNKIAKGCKKGRNSFYSIVGFGPKSNNLNPMTAVNLYKKIVLPSALYGCETWSNITKTDIIKLNVFQHRCLKTIQKLPIQTRSVIVENLVGINPITTEIEKRKLCLLEKLGNMTNENISKNIFIRTLFQYKTRNNTDCQYGFVPDIFKILSKFNLLEYIEMYMKSNKFPNKILLETSCQKANYSYRANDNSKCTTKY